MGLSRIASEYEIKIFTRISSKHEIKDFCRESVVFIMSKTQHRSRTLWVNLWLHYNRKSWISMRDGSVAIWFQVRYYLLGPCFHSLIDQVPALRLWGWYLALLPPHFVRHHRPRFNGRRCGKIDHTHRCTFWPGIYQRYIHCPSFIPLHSPQKYTLPSQVTVKTFSKSKIFLKLTFRCQTLKVPKVAAFSPYLRIQRCSRQMGQVLLRSRSDFFRHI